MFEKKSYEYIGLERHFFSGIVLPILFKYYKKILVNKIFHA
jgi:hypothetical protein